MVIGLRAAFKNRYRAEIAYRPGSCIKTIYYRRAAKAKQGKKRRESAAVRRAETDQTASRGSSISDGEKIAINNRAFTSQRVLIYIRCAQIFLWQGKRQ